MDPATIEYLGDLASILTAVAAVCVWTVYGGSRWRKRKKLERYLKTEKEKGQDKGQCSFLHLMAKVGLTESEILQASFNSRYIRRRLVTEPDTGLAKDILFEYDSSGTANRM